MDTNKEKIGRYTSDKFSFNDYLSVSSYFKNEDNNEVLKKNMEADWNETEATIVNKERLDQILHRLHDQIDKNMNVKASLIQIFYQSFSKVAAILLIPALITIAVLSYITLTWSVNTDSWVEIHSPVGSRTKFQLPDGSQGWLNGGSSIKYPVNFMNHRNVEISGEAWFNVVHLKSKDFRVTTPFFVVKVLGTQFNVYAYDDDPNVSVILERGKVILLGEKDKVIGELEPDQQFVYNKLTKDITKTIIDSKSYSRWKDGLLIFRDEPMAAIAKRLDRKYNAEIILHGDPLKSSIFRATFQDENLDEICKLLSTVAPITYKISNSERQADGTFTKSKVEIWLKNNLN